MNDLGYKIVLIGDAGVGKSSILAFLMNDRPPTEPTVGAAYAYKKIKINEREVKLNIWDTAGQERYKSLAPIYYRNASGCMCVFDLTNKSSFQNLEHWITEFKDGDITKNKKIMIVANKCDCNEYDWCTTEENIKSLAEEYNCDYILTSCINGTNINEAFHRLAESISEIYFAPIISDPIPQTDFQDKNKNQIIGFAEKILPSKIPFTSTQC